MSEWAIKCVELLTTKQSNKNDCKKKTDRHTHSQIEKQQQKTSYFIQCYFELKARIKPDTLKKREKWTEEKQAGSFSFSLYFF